MKKLDGVWWTTNSKQISGTLTITDENKITLITYEEIQEPRIINGFSGGEKITLIDGQLDRKDVYYKPEEKQEFEHTLIEKNEEVQYCTYTYIAEMVILGHDYKRKGDIRLQSLELKYTNLDEWVNWKLEEPEVKQTKNNIIVKFKKFHQK